MQQLYTSGAWSFWVTPEWHPSFLEPVSHYVQWKRAHQWDDYNELAHATRFFEEATQNKGLTVDSHLLKNGEAIVGCVFIVMGEIDTIERRYIINNPATSVILKYFHIKEKGQGLGQLWLKEVLIPYYAGKGYQHIYLSSSHPQSFGFYQKFGQEIGSYTSKSDHELFEREGRCFRVGVK